MADSKPSVSNREHKRLTRRQGQVLAYLRQREAKGYRCPSRMEVAAAIGLPAASHSVVSVIIARLEADGYLTRAPGAKRNIRLARPPSEALNAGEVAWCCAHPEAVRALRRVMDQRRGM